MKPMMVTSRRSREFICRTDVAAISLASRAARGGPCAARCRGFALLLGYGLRILRAFQVELQQVLLTIAADHLRGALDLRVTRTRKVGEGGRDGLRLGDRTGDAPHHDVPLLKIELLDVMLDRRRNRLREADHHVETVGMRHGILVAESGLLHEELLRVLRARRLGAEDLLGHGAQRAFEGVALAVRLVDSRPPAEDEAHEKHRRQTREDRDAFSHPRKPSFERQRTPPEVQAGPPAGEREGEGQGLGIARQLVLRAGQYAHVERRLRKKLHRDLELTGQESLSAGYERASSAEEYPLGRGAAPRAM